MFARLSFLLFVFLFGIVSWASGATDILIIESYHSEFLWDASYLRGLNDKLSGFSIKKFEMDTKRLPQEDHKHRADLAWEFYKETNPKLVILGDDNALKYLAPQFATTYTPVVYLGINRNPRDYIEEGAKNFTGVLERPLLKRNVATTSKLVDPRLKKVLILFDSGTTSRASVKEVFKGETELEIFGTVAKLELVGDWDKWQKLVNEASDNGYDAIIVGLYHTIIDEYDNHVSASKVLSWTSENTRVPIFGFWDFAVGAGKTSGGLVMDGYVQGVDAAKIVKRILNGETPISILPQTSKDGKLVFSKSQSERFGLVIPRSVQKNAKWVD